MKTPYNFKKSLEIFQKAAEVIPSGISGNKNPAFAVPGSFPYFAKSGRGCRYIDVDDNEYIDYLAAYGPIVLGYNDPVIEKAASEQRIDGTVFNHPTETAVKLAEKLVDTISGMSWCAFGKNGSDVTAYAVQTAREHTQKRKILKVRGAYHGSQSWCRHNPGGLIDSDYEHVLDFCWNDAQEVEDIIRKTGDVACVIITPYHHPAFGDQILPAPGFLNDLRNICDKYEAVLISDDVRAGFRLDLKGSHVYFDFEPDIACYCKAMANGYAVSACCGNPKMKNAASKVFFTGTYYTSAPEQAAAIACLEELKNSNAINHMMKMGRMLIRGLEEKAASLGLEITMSGPPTLPFMTFSNEKNFRRSQYFSGEAAKRGIIMHPHHNWFIMRDHSEEDIRETLEICGECFEAVKKKFGS